MRKVKMPGLRLPRNSPPWKREVGKDFWKAKAEVRKALKELDSCFRRNDTPRPKGTFPTTRKVPRILESQGLKKYYRGVR
jgi:hypothetical protein